MSDGLNLHAYFNAPSHITSTDMIADLLDDFVTGVAIYDLPADLSPQSYIIDFFEQAIMSLSGFPNLEFRTRNEALYPGDGTAERTTYTEIAFESPVDSDLAMMLLKKVVKNHLVAYGIPEDRHVYKIHEASDLTYQEIKAEKASYRPPPTSSGSPRLGM